MNYQEHFIKCWPNEGVGYLKDGQFFPLENIAEDPANSFEVDPSFLLEEPDALLHSHCTGVTKQIDDPHIPSYQDLLGQQHTAIEWGICVTDGEICEEPICWGNPNNRPPLLDRTFIFNVQDCLALMQDWYYQEHAIVLPTQPRTPHWYDEGQNYFEDLYQDWGFEKVSLDELQRGDLLFYQVRSPVVNHIGIYMGDNEVLSHWFGRVSCIEGVGKWASHIKFAARYTK
ncbi:C40 family peptidase [Aquabacterium sp.]|uniref:C40 family peptidase n=1 Tax=Aquabacterium sp. TaxID=1872578 RepID=UPI003D6CB6F2